MPSIDPNNYHPDAYFMDMAKQVATKSKDHSKQVGCVITTTDDVFVSAGFNRFPRGCCDNPAGAQDYFKDQIKARFERPLKYKWTEHAERDAIYSVARNGGPALKGCKIYVPWFPCVDCARAIIEAGITTVVAYRPDFDDARWGEDFKISVEMFTEAGVHIRLLTTPELAEDA